MYIYINIPINKLFFLFFMDKKTLFTIILI